MNKRRKLLNELQYIAKTGRDLLEPLLSYWEDAGSPGELSLAQDLAKQGKDLWEMPLSSWVREDNPREEAGHLEIGPREAVISTKTESRPETQPGKTAYPSLYRSSTLEITENPVRFAVDRADRTALAWYSLEDKEPSNAVLQRNSLANSPSIAQSPARETGLQATEPVHREEATETETLQATGQGNDVTDRKSKENPHSWELSSSPEDLGKELGALPTPKSPQNQVDSIPFLGPVIADVEPIPSAQSQPSEAEVVQGTKDEELLKAAELPLIEADKEELEPQSALPRSSSLQSPLPPAFQPCEGAEESENPKETEGNSGEAGELGQTEAQYKEIRAEINTSKGLFPHRSDPDSSLVVSDLFLPQVSVPFHITSSFLTDFEPNQPVFEAEHCTAPTTLETSNAGLVVQSIDQGEGFNPPTVAAFYESVTPIQEYHPDESIDMENKPGELRNSQGKGSEIGDFEGLEDCGHSSVEDFQYIDLCEEGKDLISDSVPVWPNRLERLEMALFPSPEPEQTASPLQSAGNLALSLGEQLQMEQFRGDMAGMEETGQKAEQKIERCESGGSLHSEKREKQAFDQLFKDDLSQRSGNSADLSLKTEENPAENAQQSSSSASRAPFPLDSAISSHSNMSSEQPSADLAQFPGVETPWPVLPPSSLPPPAEAEELKLSTVIRDNVPLPSPEKLLPLQVSGSSSPQPTELQPKPQENCFSAALEPLGSSGLLPALGNTAWPGDKSDKMESEVREKPGEMREWGERGAEFSQLDIDKDQIAVPDREIAPFRAELVLSSIPNTASHPKNRKTVIVKASTPEFSPQRPSFPLKTPTIWTYSTLDEENPPLQSIFPTEIQSRSSPEAPPLHYEQKSSSPVLESADNWPSPPYSAPIQADIQPSEAKSGPITPSGGQASVLPEGAAVLTDKSSSSSSRPTSKAYKPESHSSTPPNTAIHPPSFIPAPQFSYFPGLDTPLFLSPDSEDFSLGDSARAAWTAAQRMTTRGVEALDLLAPATAPSDTIGRMPIKAASSSLNPGNRRIKHGRKKPALQLSSSAGLVGFSGCKVVHSLKSGVAWGGWDASGLPDFPHLRKHSLLKLRTKPHRNPYEAGWSKRIMKDFFHLKMVVPPFTSLPVLTVTKLEGRTVHPSELRTVRSQGELRELHFVRSWKKLLKES